MKSWNEVLSISACGCSLVLWNGWCLGRQSIHALSSAQVPATIQKIVSARGSLPLTQRRLCGGLREMDSIKLQGPAENH